MPRRMGIVGRSGILDDRAVRDWASNEALVQCIGFETPCKRRRRSKSRSSCPDSLVSPWTLSQNDSQNAGRASQGILGLLAADVLTESLAMLYTQDILQSAMVCSAWQHTASSPALWALAAPRLGLARRIVQREEVTRRMSRGVVKYGVLLGERKQRVALRTLDLCTANAGQDDGLLPSIVREVANLQLLSRKHPNIVNFIGAEVDGPFVHIVTEHVASSFEAWFAEPCPMKQLRGLRTRGNRASLGEQLKVCDRFWQLFKGLEFLHSSGVFHRNLTPGNVLVNPSTDTVKISDFAYGRTLDTPLRAYSPEHPKLRPRSIREARRLWYKAPELLLRLPVYGPAIDVWSAGCMMVEAACKEPLFPSEGELDHLFRVFQLVGTPSQDLWPDGMHCPQFSPKFPVYKPVDLTSAEPLGRVAGECWWNSTDGKERREVLALVSRCALVLKTSGMTLLSNLLKLDPAKRFSPAHAWRSLGQQMAELLRSDQDGGQLGKSHSQCERLATITGRCPCRPFCRLRSQSSTSANHEGDLKTQAVCPGLQIIQKNSESHAAGASFPPLWRQMVLVETMHRQARPASLCTGAADTNATRHAHTTCVDLMVCMATKLEISDFALHMAGTILDEYLLRSSPSEMLDRTLAAVVCLKLAETLDEHSYEYFQRERTELYVRSCDNRFTKSAILAAEKEVAQRLQFAFHCPSASWFLRTCAHVGGQPLLDTPRVVGLACMFLDLSLLHPNSQAHPAPLRGQAALLLALHAALSSLMPGARKAASMASALWRPVRRKTCGENRREPAVRCLEHMVFVVFSLREQLRMRGLHGVEQRCRDAARISLSPSCIPSDLVEELLPISD